MMNVDNREPLFQEVFDSLKEAMAGLRFGTVSLTVHDGQVVQIDVTEKKRLALKPQR